MKAIIKIQGKQLTVEKGNIFSVNRFQNTKEGDTVTVNDVLLIGEGSNAKIGNPTVKGASVTAKILENKRGEKIHIFKKKRRKGYERHRGHRQELSVIKVESINA